MSFISLLSEPFNEILSFLPAPPYSRPIGFHNHLCVNMIWGPPLGRRVYDKEGDLLPHDFTFAVDGLLPIVHLFLSAI